MHNTPIIICYRRNHFVITQARPIVNNAEYVTGSLLTIATMR